MIIKKAPGLLAILIIGLLSIGLFAGDQFVDQFTLSKHYYFSFLFIPFALILVYSLIKSNKKTELHLTYLDVWVSLFYLYSIIRLVFTPNEVLLNPNVLNHTLLFVLYWIVKTAIKAYTDNELKNHFTYLISGLNILLILYSIYGLFEYFSIIKPSNSDFKIGGAFGNPGPYANFLAALVPFSLVAVFNKELFSKNNGYLSIVALLLTIAVLPFTMSRTAWISFVVVSIILSFILLQNKPFFKDILSKTYIKTGGLILLVVIIVGIAYSLFDIKKESASGRLFIWKITQQSISDNPIVGNGYDSFSYSYNANQAAHFEKSSTKYEEEGLLADNSTFAFNEFLQITTELGILGLILFLLLIVTALKSKLVLANIYRSILFLSAKLVVVSIIICSLFSYPLHVLPILTLFYLVLAIISGNTGSINKFQLNINPNFCRVCGYLLLVVFTLMYFLIINRYWSEKEWKALMNTKKNMPTASLQKRYEALVPVMEYNKYFMFNYGAEMIAAKQYAIGTGIMEKTLSRINDSNIYIYLGLSYYAKSQLDKAEICFKKASNIVPSKLYPLYNLVKIYHKTNRVTDALALAKDIIDRGEKVETPIGNGILIEMNEYIRTGKLKD
jgi:O-antigen polymerase